jgi:hypothetical protein
MLLVAMLPLLVIGWSTQQPKPVSAAASGDQTIYDDSLLNGWQDYGWATINYHNAQPIHSGGASISVREAPWQGLSIHHDAMDSTPYSALSFWISGGGVGGQRLQVQGLLNGKAQPAVGLAPLSKNQWQRITLPLSSLGVAHRTDFDGFWIIDATGASQPVFYVDDIALSGVPSPSVVAVNIDASDRIRTVDSRLFGINTGMWYSNLNAPDTISALNRMGNRAIRFPGGDLSEQYDWATNRTIGDNDPWVATMADFASLVEKTHSTAYITVNYGSGTAQEAAALVAWANASPNNSTPLGTDSKGVNWATAGHWAALRAAAPLKVDDGLNFLRAGHIAPLHFEYWEIGNETYGSWEHDDHPRPHDPFTYAGIAAQYMRLMRQIDPSIQIGVSVTEGEDGFATYTDHPATNPRTGKSHNGWTPVLLSTLKKLGARPDFVIEHYYAQNAGTESDAGLLQSAKKWSTIVSGLRTQLNDYLGAAVAAKVEIDCTENNSVSGNPGKQTTSLVNGLFLADSIGDAMQTELRSLLWWDLRDGDLLKNNNNSAALYGWRENGSYNVVASATDYYPTFYARELLTHFAAGGDSVVRAGSDYDLLDAFAVRRSNHGLTVLLINKSPAGTFHGTITLTGFRAAPSAILYSYGETQDTAAQTGVGSHDIATTTITINGTAPTFTIPPYTMEVVVLRPAVS